MIYTSDIVRVSVNRPVAIDTHYKILEWCNENHISAEWINCQVVADKMHFFFIAYPMIRIKLLFFCVGYNAYIRSY